MIQSEFGNNMGLLMFILISNLHYVRELPAFGWDTLENNQFHTPVFKAIPSADAEEYG